MSLKLEIGCLRWRVWFLDDVRIRIPMSLSVSCPVDTGTAGFSGESEHHRIFQTPSFLDVGPEYSIISSLCTNVRDPDPFFSKAVPGFPLLLRHHNHIETLPNSIIKSCLLTRKFYEILWHNFIVQRMQFLYCKRVALLMHELQVH